MTSPFSRYAETCKRFAGGSAALGIVLSVGLSTSARAQTVNRTDLIGFWAVQGETKAHIILQPDSTVTVMVNSSRGVHPATGHWELKGDTLIVGELVAKVGQEKATFRPGPRLVKLKDSQLTLVKIDDQEQGPPSRVYERVADSTQANPDSAKTPSTP